MIRPPRILIEKNALPYKASDEIISRLGNVPVETINSVSDIKGSMKIPLNTLVLAKQEGKFLKHCPCTPSHVCCGYYFLNLSTQCTVGCSYCILQGYLDNPFLTVYVNIEDLYEEVGSYLAENHNFCRIGTGELTDSLLLDDITSHSSSLIEFFTRTSNAALELKTKTACIKNLLKINPEKKIITSWSVNPEKIIQSDEPGAASLRERLEAARLCSNSGYLIGFHIDPVLYYNGWEHDYRDLVEMIFRHVEPENIVWISLGTLRYPGHMDALFRKNHPGSRIFLAEMFPGRDGKLRYFRPLREYIYKKIRSWIGGFSADVMIYLCMESPEVWASVFGDDYLHGIRSLPDEMDRAYLKKSRRGKTA